MATKKELSEMTNGELLEVIKGLQSENRKLAGDLKAAALNAEALEKQNAQLISERNDVTAKVQGFGLDSATESAIAEKIKAGLTREDATAVVLRQQARDKQAAETSKAAKV